MTRPSGGVLATALRVGGALARHRIRGVLTGGACASLYTGGRYQSVDVDFVIAGSVTQTRLDAAMSSVGFERRRDRYVSRSSPFYVEFPAGPLAVGADHRIRPVVHRGGSTRMLVLSPTDSCRDRLAAYYHWNDRQSLAVAVEIALRHRVRISLIGRWSEGEGAADRFREFLAERARGRRMTGARRPAVRRVAPRRATS